jgi:tetratricopeptide (TPR) repeat protein
VAELEMNLGLVIHTLAGAGQAPIKDAIAVYQAALRFFSAQQFPREFATLHNNLATAYLAMRLAPEKEGMREALAVQSFQEALRVVTLDDDPVEYAMLQNNLGNALQAVASVHHLENLERAIAAYDEALRVRTVFDMPVEHANTLVNKANALMNLPDAVDADTNPKNLAAAVELLLAAEAVFGTHGVHDRAAIAAECRTGLQAELAAMEHAG